MSHLLITSLVGCTFQFLVCETNHSFGLPEWEAVHQIYRFYCYDPVHDCCAYARDWNYGYDYDDDGHHGYHAHDYDCCCDYDCGSFGFAANQELDLCDSDRGYGRAHLDDFQPFLCQNRDFFPFLELAMYPYGRVPYLLLVQPFDYRSRSPYVPVP